MSGSSDCSCVKTDTFAETTLQCYVERSDHWGFAVKDRIEYYGCDSQAADCVYHYSCDGNVRSGLDIPERFKNEPKAQKIRETQEWGQAASIFNVLLLFRG